jgi:hypothetical protein
MCELESYQEARTVPPSSPGQMIDRPVRLDLKRNTNATTTTPHSSLRAPGSSLTLGVSGGKITKTGPSKTIQRAKSTLNISAFDAHTETNEPPPNPTKSRPMSVLSSFGFAALLPKSRLPQSKVDKLTSINPNDRPKIKDGDQRRNRQHGSVR